MWFGSKAESQINWQQLARPQGIIWPNRAESALSPHFLTDGPTSPQSSNLTT